MTREITLHPNHVSLIEGATGCGKTTALIGYALSQIEEGRRPAELLVLAATPAAAAALERRLQQNGVAEATVTTAQAMGLRVIEAARRRGLSSRSGRLATAEDRRRVAEKVHTSGIRPGRLREMMKFFLRGWTELAEDDPAWLISEEERIVHGLMKEALQELDVVLAEEVSPLALRLLREHPDLRDELAFPVVLLDDAQLLQRASLHLACALASDWLAAAGDDRATAAVFEPFPYPAGLGELRAIATETERLDACRRASGAALAAAVLGAYPEAPADGAAAADLPADSLTLISEKTRARQIDRVADEIIREIENGTAPGDIWVLCFHDRLRETLGQGLAERGVPMGSDGASVRLDAGEGLIGQNPAVVVAADLVNGAAPDAACFDDTDRLPAERDRLVKAWAERLYHLLGKPERRLILACFREYSMVSAVELGLKIDRIRFRDGQRVAALQPSLFYERIREAARA